MSFYKYYSKINRLCKISTLDIYFCLTYFVHNSLCSLLQSRQTYQCQEEKYIVIMNNCEVYCGSYFVYTISVSSHRCIECRYDGYSHLYIRDWDMKGLINVPKVTKLRSGKKGLSAWFVRLLRSVYLNHNVMLCPWLKCLDSFKAK